MNWNDVESGLRVKTNNDLGQIIGTKIKEKNLSVRKPKVIGTVLHYVHGHGAKIWFVQHDDCQEIGAYHIDEFEPIA